MSYPIKLKFALCISMFIILDILHYEFGVTQLSLFQYALSRHYPPNPRHLFG